MTKHKYSELKDSQPRKPHSWLDIAKLVRDTKIMQQSITPESVTWYHPNGLATKIANTKNNYIAWLGHNSYLIRINNTHVLTDPIFSTYASPIPFCGPKRVVPSALNINTLPKIDYVLITHNHYDHLDKPTIKVLEKKFSPTIIIPQGLSHLLKKWKVSHIVELDWQESITLENIKITSLPAYHFSRRTLFDRNLSRWCGYAIEHNRLKIFHSGDTGYGNIFKTIGEQFGYFDYAMIGIGAYQPRSMMQRVHTNPEEAVLIALDIKAKTLLPMHWGTIPLSPEPLAEPINRLLQLNEIKNKSLDLQLTNIGDLITINKS